MILKNKTLFLLLFLALIFNLFLSYLYTNKNDYDIYCQKFIKSEAQENNNLLIINKLIDKLIYLNTFSALYLVTTYIILLIKKKWRKYLYWLLLQLGILIFISTANFLISSRDGLSETAYSYGSKAIIKTILSNPFILIVGFFSSTLCIIKFIKIKKEKTHETKINDNETKIPDTSKYIERIENYKYPGIRNL